jgi:tetratricopeptide (TPR) repeat protein
MGESYTLLGMGGFLPFEEAYPQALEAAKRAIELDDSLAEGHVSLGAASLMAWNWAVAGQELRHKDLNPNSSPAHRDYGVYLLANGKLSAALAETKIAKELDPLSAMSSLLSGVVYTFQLDYDAAVKEFQNVLQISPTSAIGHWNLSVAYWGQSKFKEFATELAEGYRVSGDSQHASVIEDAYQRGSVRSNDPDQCFFGSAL